MQGETEAAHFPSVFPTRLFPRDAAGISEPSKHKKNLQLLDDVLDA